MAGKAGNLVVIGAGIVGTTAAIFAARAGYDVSLFEGRSDPRRELIALGNETSFNIALTLRGLRALDEIDLGEKVRDASFRSVGRTIHRRDRTFFCRYGNRGESLYSIHRGLLARMLLDAADATDNLELHFGHKVVDVDLETCALSILDVESHETRKVEAERIIAADGAKSRVRRSMARQDSFQDVFEPTLWGYREQPVDRVVASEWPHAEESLHIWPRGDMLLIALPNRDGSHSFTLFLPHTGESSPGSFADYPAFAEFLQTQFADAGITPALVPTWTDSPLRQLGTLKCFPWTLGRKLVLLGDSAHAIPPFNSQGANFGLQDCSVLFGLLREEHGDWAAAIDRYQQTRKIDADALSGTAGSHLDIMANAMGNPSFEVKLQTELEVNRVLGAHGMSPYQNLAFSSGPVAYLRTREPAYNAAIARLMADDGFLARARNDDPATRELIGETFKQVPEWRWD